jgi:hypothetical protein
MSSGHNWLDATFQEHTHNFSAHHSLAVRLLNPKYSIKQLLATGFSSDVNMFFQDFFGTPSRTSANFGRHMLAADESLR